MFEYPFSLSMFYYFYFYFFQYLSIHSPVFKTMFFGGFVEKEKEEVEIKDVDFKV